MTIKKDHIRVLIICGCSYSGKTTLAKDLDNYLMYRRLISHTTRPIRDGESNHLDYHFVNIERFNIVQKSYGDYFMGVLENFDGNKYGTVFSKDSNMMTGINVVVLAYDAILDFLKKKEKIESYGNIVFDVFILGLDIDTKYALQRGRSEEFINKEREVLVLSDYVYNVHPSEEGGLVYMSPADLTDIIFRLKPEMFNKNFYD